MANYLYNGVELPALPEWDKETFPYAVWCVDEDYKKDVFYTLVISTAPLHITADGGAIFGKNTLVGVPSVDDNGHIIYGDRLVKYTEYMPSGYGTGLFDEIQYPWEGAGTEPTWSPEYKETYGTFYKSDPFWANYDVLACTPELQPLSEIALYASEPVPVHTLTESDFYRVINGAWVKCDTVRKMGNEWVTQDEYRY